MTFPLMPAVPPPVKTTTPSLTLIGTTQTTGDGFPSGTLPVTSGTKIVVVALDQAGSLASAVTLDGVSMILAASRDVNLKTAAVWYLETSSSGNLAISGTGGGGGGRSVLYGFEMRNYTSVTPIFTSDAGSTDGSTLAFSANTPYRGTFFGAGMADPGTVTMTADRGETPTLSNTNLESASSHFTYRQVGTEVGPTTYTLTYPAGATQDAAVAYAVWI